MAGGGVRVLRRPVHAIAASGSCPVGDRGDQGAADAAATHVDIGEQVLEVADVGAVRVRMRHEVHDPDELTFGPGPEGVDRVVVLKSRPGSVVLGVRQFALVEVDVGAEQRFPPGAVGGGEPADVDLGRVA